ncbi:MAG TPA: autotransporter domain-containing protein [Stenotrophomonas sp.]|nr:autotransporter domain-containing protein [Stenotrophomonas sp.]
MHFRNKQRWVLAAHPRGGDAQLNPAGHSSTVVLGLRPARLSCCIGTALLCGLLSWPSLALAQVNGREGVPESWRTPEFERSWGLAAINAHYAYARGLTGRDVSIGQYDQGVALQHPEFSDRGHVALSLAQAGCSPTPGRVVLRGSDNCFATRGDQLNEGIEYVQWPSGQSRSVEKYADHGTMTAGLMVAARDGAGTHGVAFDSRMVAGNFQALFAFNAWRTREGKFSLRTEATSPWNYFPEVIRSYYSQLRDHGVDVSNMETWRPVPASPASANTLAGVEGQYQAEKQMFDAYADGAKQHAILNVVTLGNDNGRIANPYAGLPHFRPDAEPYWMSVANLRKDAGGGYSIDPSSSICSYTRMWCISAPGTDTYAPGMTGSSGGTMIGNLQGRGPLAWQVGSTAPTMTYRKAGGTSSAAPHVTGGIALLLQRFPYLTVTQVRDIALTTATDLGAPGPDDIYGWGLLNLRKAIDGPGQLLVDTHVQMKHRAGGTQVWSGQAWDDWRNDIGGKGVLTKSGEGILRLSGRNRFGGLRVREGAIELTGDNAYPAQVDGGTLQIDGTLASATLPVMSAGRLQGSGRIIGDVHMAGTLAPGNSIGTLSVQGNYVQAAGSTYLAEVAPDGRSDRLEVSGTARLEGGRVVVLPAPGKYWLGQSYDLLYAAGGVQGRFAGVERAALSPFLAFGLSYSARTAALQVSRGQWLAAYARTPNQRAAAAAADRLSMDHALARALTQLEPTPAMAALDALSGASHASVSTLLFEQGRRLREVALDRARAGRGSFDADRRGESSRGVWADIQATSTTLPTDGNAAAASAQGNVLLLGYDHRFESGVRVGLLGGAIRADARLGQDRGRIRGTQVGLYAGQNWGAFNAAASLGWSGNDIRLDRSIDFSGFADRTQANYAARTRQFAMEVSYRFTLAASEWMPYAEWARAWVERGAFQEQGGVAALTGAKESTRVDFSTAGLRFGVDLRSRGQDTGWLRLQGAIGRRRASGDLLPTATLHWRGGDPFTVSGLPLAKWTTVASLGVTARITRNGALYLGYQGQYADAVRDHALQARYSLRF